MPSPHQRDVDFAHLHPAVREAVSRVIQKLNAEGHKFRLFEGFRTPQRQAYLYSQGRTRPGPRVTNAQPWMSYHQYGLSADLVLYDDGRWSWETGGAYRDSWTRMHQIGRDERLEPLSWEMPHLQLAGTSLDQLTVGRYPPGGDESWAENIEAAIASWTGSPAAPEPPQPLPLRPAIGDDVESDIAGIDAALLTSEVPAVGEQDWHSIHGGREWRYDSNGST